MPPLNRDRLNHIPTTVAANDAIAVLDRLQNFPPERQIVALATVYRMMAEHFGVSPQDIHTVSDNIVNTATGRRSEFEAVRAYMEGELS